MKCKVRELDKSNNKFYKVVKEGFFDKVIFDLRFEFWEGMFLVEDIVNERFL